MKNKGYTIIQILIGIAIVIAIVYTTDFEEVAEILTNLNFLFLTLAVLAYFLNNFIMAYRLHIIFKKVDKKIRLGQVFWAHMCGMIVSDFTPARSGYMYSLVPLKKRGIKPEAALSTISYCYVFDLILKVVFGAVAVLMILSLIGIPGYILRVLSIGLMIVALLIVVALTFFNIHIPDRIRKILEKHRIGSFILKVQKESAKVRGFIPMILSISFLGWILRGFEWFMIGRALGIDLSILKSLFLNPLLTALSMVPFTSAGLGIQEFGISETFSLIGVPISASVAFAVIVRVMNTSVDCLGLKGFFISEITGTGLRERYEEVQGDIDEIAYNSDILIQRHWQRRRIKNLFENTKIGQNELILDMGCGSGVISRKCTEFGGKVVGFDLSRPGVLYARSRGNEKTNFIVADAQNLPFKPHTFDVAILGNIIEHVPEPERMIAEVSGILKPGGRVSITMPNSNSLWSLIEFFWDHFGKGRNYAEQHLRIFSPKELKELLKDNDVNVYHVSTLFVLSPFIALLNSERLLALLQGLEKRLELLGVGCDILICGRKEG
ncbi:flippase-like domain-containing protein [Halobacteriota archaeon]